MLLGSHLPGTRMGSVCLGRARGPLWVTLRLKDPTPRARATSLPPAVFLLQQVGALLTIVGGQQEHGRVAIAPNPVNPLLLGAIGDGNVLLSLKQHLCSGPSPAPQPPLGNSSHLLLPTQSQRADPTSSQPHGPSSGCNERRTSVCVYGRSQNPRTMRTEPWGEGSSRTPER